jgi:hypothetical protein
MYIVIPPDHAERGVVPICISDVDYEGRLVVPGWIEAVKPIAEPLRRMTSVITGDVHNVSQVTEEAVHSLSARRGEKLGRKPSSQVFASAKWRAHNLKLGDSRVRKGLEVEFREIMAECLTVAPDFAGAIENQDLVARLRKRARERGRHDLETLLDLYLSGAEDQIPRVFGVQPNSQERNTLSQRFYRGIRSLLESL